MKNVERDYAVVGSWEDVNVTLTVLEHYVPSYFRGAHQLYYGNHKFDCNMLSLTFAYLMQMNIRVWPKNQETAIPGNRKLVNKSKICCVKILPEKWSFITFANRDCIGSIMP